jgi:peptide-methionine (S)-S-oxide reductase
VLRPPVLSRFLTILTVARAMSTDAKADEVITLGAGCFWCVEAVYLSVPGVKSAVSGYMGGHVANPTYKDVCSGTTGHAEVVQVTWDTTTCNLDNVLDMFFKAHDPTTLNRQGHDVGTQYRSAIYYHSEQQKEVAQAALTRAQEHWPDPIVTEITPASEFYPAEDYHQNYYALNKNKNPYCQRVIKPKLKKLGIEK